MDCYEVELLLPDYIDMLLNAADRKTVEEHIKDCVACMCVLDEYKGLLMHIKHDNLRKPSPVLREKFEIMLHQEMDIAEASAVVNMNPTDKSKYRTRNTYLWFYRVAASMLLIGSGFLAGTIITGRNKETMQIAQLKGELREMKETLAVNLLNESSASERIKAVSFVEKITDPDNKVIEALIKTMNEDNNVNVRLAALYALEKFTNNEKVIDAMITSLNEQHEPLMQIALINILTEKKEIKAKEPIREIFQDKNTLPPVKEIAQKGLKIL